jgi:protein-disulfide isomerase
MQPWQRMTMSRASLRRRGGGACSSGRFTPTWGVALVAIGLLVRTTAVFANGEAVAAIDGDVITADDVAKLVSAPISRLEEQVYTLKRRALDALIADRLVVKEAARRQMSVQALVEAETRDAAVVTEQEIEIAYRQQRAPLKGDEAAVKEQVREQLRALKVAARQRAFVDQLRARSVVVVNLQPPTPSRVELKIDGAPFKGPATAPVTIVEFQDFHCPFCQRVQSTLVQLAARYGDRVKLVYRDFPIDSLHPQARNAHEAARCANAQGRFWSYHDALYAKPPNGSLDGLKAIAKEADVELEAFERCLNARTYRSAVQSDIDEGTRLGVAGTPTFFINGRVISGAQPLETFTRIVDEELARLN